MHEPAVEIVAFGAHPDDVEIGAGGAIAAATARGERVVIIDLTRGEQASAGDPVTRAREAAQAAAMLGAAERRCLGLPDAALVDDPPSRLRVVEAMRCYRPRIVLAPPWHDRHPDHRAAAALVRDACHLAGVRRIGTGAPFRPCKIYHYALHEPAEADLVVDISATWACKRDAIAAYASQFVRGSGDDGAATSLNGGAFMRALEARAIAWGAMIGARYGEAYRCHGPVPVARLPALDDGTADDDWTAYRIP